MSNLSISIVEVGSDVVATVSGAIDLSGLTIDVTQSVVDGINGGGGGELKFSNSTLTRYDGMSSGVVQGAFGSNTLTPGDTLSINNEFAFISLISANPILLVDAAYVSNTSISGTLTFTGKSLFLMGLTLGSYSWSWNGGVNTLSLEIGASPTPTPTSTVTITPTSTPTFTPTVTPTNTPTNTVTPTITQSSGAPSATPTNTPTKTPTASVTPTISVTPSITPTKTPTSTVTPSITPSTTSSPLPIGYYYAVPCGGSYGISIKTYDTDLIIPGQVNELNLNGNINCYTILTAPVGPSQSASVVSGPWIDCVSCGTNVTPTPTPSVTTSPTVTPTKTPTVTPTASVTPTISVTPTKTQTNTPTPTVTSSVTPTLTPSPTEWGTLDVDVQYEYGPGQQGSYSGGTWNTGLFGPNPPHPVAWNPNSETRTGNVVDLSAIKIGSDGLNN
jgi:hypothetical protein